MFGSRLRDEQRAIQATAWGDWGETVYSSSTWSGQNVDNRNALQLLAVYGCVRFIVEGISTLPIDVFRELPDGKRVEANKPAWLTQPTADLDTIAWLTQLLTSLLLDGNTYCRKVYANGALVELVPFDPVAIKVSREQGRKTYRLNGIRLDPFEILHIPGIMYPGADTGLSPVEASRQAVGTGLATEEFAGRFFGQGANLGGVIEDPGEYDPERAKKMAKGWARLHSGNRKAHLPGVLQGGATWKVTGVTNEQSQFLQTRGFSAAQISSHMFLIDPSEFGFQPERGSAITYGNLEQRNARKVQVTFLPWIIRLELALSSLMMAPRFLKFNVNGLLRGDTLTRYQTYTQAAQINTQAAALGEPPVLTTAEMRGFENLPPYEGTAPTPIAPTPEVPT
jgi:HK97 family phage portal protein